MGCLKISQDEIDSLVVVDRIEVKSTVYGFGKRDVNFQVKVNGKDVWQYVAWRNVLKRCFLSEFKFSRPTYEDVTCCDEWLSFGNFIEWVNEEVNYKGKPVGHHLDKDLILRGNKIYSPDTCSFIPSELNNLLIDHAAARGEWPVGVDYHSHTGRFRAQLSCCGRVKYLGLFETPEEAFAVYKIAKEAHIKVVALQHKAVLKPAVFDSLMSWEILNDD